MKIDFEHFRLPTGISGAQTQEGDVRESFANVIYMSTTGVKAHHLAFKIYESRGLTDYSEDEVAQMVVHAERHCTPCFIDGLKKQINENQ